MPLTLPTPDEDELSGALGPAYPLWVGILAAAGEVCAPVESTWKPSKTPFGRMCLLQHRKRTLLYLTPDLGKIWVAIVLGERAYGLAMASKLPREIKRMFQDAKPYAEGRGIRFPVDGTDGLPLVAELLRIKIA